MESQSGGGGGGGGYRERAYGAPPGDGSSREGAEGEARGGDAGEGVSRWAGASAPRHTGSPSAPSPSGSGGAGGALEAAPEGQRGVQVESEAATEGIGPALASSSPSDPLATSEPVAPSAGSGTKRARKVSPASKSAAASSGEGTGPPPVVLPRETDGEVGVTLPPPGQPAAEAGSEAEARARPAESMRRPWLNYVAQDPPGGNGSDDGGTGAKKVTKKRGSKASKSSSADGAAATGGASPPGVWAVTSRAAVAADGLCEASAGPGARLEVVDLEEEEW